MTGMRPRLLDLFCGAGGCSVGYHRAGFDVVGVDIVPQPHYPFEFYQDDAVALLADPYGPAGSFDAIHASPPCKAFTSIRAVHGRDHADLLTPTRHYLEQWGTAWVIENVPNAPMRADVKLCGSTFGLGVRRHRLFELGWQPLVLQHPCGHEWEDGPVGVYGHTGGSSTRDQVEARPNVAEWRRAMGIDWMTVAEIAQAIPPAYTEWVGSLLIQRLEEQAA